MQIRGLQRGDVERLYALDVVCFEEPFRFSRAAMRRFATAPHALVALAVESGDLGGEALLGFCIVHLERGEAGVFGYVVTLDVTPEARSRGVATLLLSTLEQKAARRGAGTLVLHVHAGNAAALALYERRGFESRGLITDFYGNGLHAVQYVRSVEDKASASDVPEVRTGTARAS